MRHQISTSVILIITVIAILFCAQFLSTSKKPSNSIVDISWPNCNESIGSFRSGIIGVTGGLDFHTNPCLNNESSWISKYALYINTGYPGPAVRKNYQSSPLKCKKTNEACMAYNYGYNAALYGIKYANSVNVHSNLWWMDVETENSWTNYTLVNRASLVGMIDAIRSHVFLAQIGFYSDQHQWSIITGGWQNNAPTWVATGSFARSDAVNACYGSSFTGGTNWLGQYTLNLDVNVACNANFYNALSI